VVKAAARQRLVPGQVSWTWAWMPLRRAGNCRLPRPGWAAYFDALTRVLMTSWALTRAAGADEVFRTLVLARILSQPQITAPGPGGRAPADQVLAAGYGARRRRRGLCSQSCMVLT
jgi:hypothetical protein